MKKKIVLLIITMLCLQMINSFNINAATVTIDYCQFRDGTSYSFPANFATIDISESIYCALLFYISSTDSAVFYRGFKIDSTIIKNESVQYFASGLPGVKYWTNLDAINWSLFSLGYHTITVFASASGYGDYTYKEQARSFYLTSSEAATNLNYTTNNFDDVYLNEQPTFSIGSFDSNGLNNCYATIDDYTNLVGFETVSLTNETISTTYNQEIAIGDKNTIEAATVTIGNKYQVLGDYYKTITFTNPTASALTNLIAYCKVTYDSDMQADFDDVCFYDSTGTTLLDFELASYIASTEAYFWVEIPSISASGTYISKMLYGNPLATCQEDLSGTWNDNGFVNVLHFDNNLIESSGNSITWSDTGAVAYTTAKVGLNSIDFDAGEYISSSMTQNDGESSYTVLFWHNSDRNDDSTIYGKDVASGSDFDIKLTTAAGASSDWYAIRQGGAGDTTYDSCRWDIDHWDYFALTGSGTTATYYLNGAVLDTDTITGTIGSGGTTFWGNTPYWTADQIDGSLDECMFVTSVLTDDYIHAFYDFQNDQASYVSFSEEHSPIVLNNDIEITYTETTTPTAEGSSFWVNFTTDTACYFNAFINISLYCAYFNVYNLSAETSSVDNWEMPLAVWNNLTEGYFWFSVLLENDISEEYIADYRLCKSTIPATIDILSPLNNSIHNLGDPLGFSFIFDLVFGYDYYEFVFLNGTQKTFETGDSLFLALGVWNITVIIVDEAGNYAEETVWFEIIKYETCQITYLDTFQNVVDFERFNTYVTTSRFSRYNELDSYIKLETDDQAYIETFARDGSLLQAAYYEYSERIFVDLKVHFVQWMNTNITTDVTVAVSWSWDGSSNWAGSISFTLSQGMISEALMIYADAYYSINYYARGYRDTVYNTSLVLGSTLVHYTMPLSLTPKTDLGSTISQGISLLTGLLTPVLLLLAINNYHKKQNKLFWGMLFGGVIVGILSLSLAGSIQITSINLAFIVGGLIICMIYTLRKKKVVNK